MKKLAIIASHPIQYNAPWFHHLAATGEIDLRVYYLWDFGVSGEVDPGFMRQVKWDIPLLSGYAHEFVPNVARDPGTHHFSGLLNPELSRRVSAFGPDAVLMFSYAFASTYRFLWTFRRAPLLFRGDSHRLVRRRGPLAWASRAMIALTFSRFSAFLYVGKANRRYFTYHGVPERRLFFAPHAVDNARFSGAREEAERAAAAWKRELGIPDGDAVILFAGKLEPIKRVADLVRAYRAAKVPRAALLLVGGGPLEAEIRREAEGDPTIHFAPFQNQMQMPRTWAACDVMVLSSESESWGLSVNEAMCLGRPAILGDRVGCAEDLVRSGENGLIFPTGDIPALTRCLKQALSDRGRLRAWGERSAEIVSRYSYAQMTEGLTRALDHLGGRGQSAWQA